MKTVLVIDSRFFIRFSLPYDVPEIISSVCRHFVQQVKCLCDADTRSDSTVNRNRIWSPDSLLVNPVGVAFTAVQSGLTTPLNGNTWARKTLLPSGAVGDVYTRNIWLRYDVSNTNEIKTHRNSRKCRWMKVLKSEFNTDSRFKDIWSKPTVDQKNYAYLPFRKGQSYLKQENITAIYLSWRRYFFFLHKIFFPPNWRPVLLITSLQMLITVILYVMLPY